MHFSAIPRAGASDEDAAYASPCLRLVMLFGGLNSRPTAAHSLSSHTCGIQQPECGPKLWKGAIGCQQTLSAMQQGRAAAATAVAARRLAAHAAMATSSAACMCFSGRTAPRGHLAGAVQHAWPGACAPNGRPAGLLTES